jgi:hypothetical protein
MLSRSMNTVKQSLWRTFARKGLSRNVRRRRMGLWENFGWQEIWLTLAVWLLLRRYGPAGRKSRQSKHSSKRTVPKQTLPELDPAKAHIQSPCIRCGVMRFVTLTGTRLEGPPWRVWWVCHDCGADSYAKCPQEFAEVLMRLDRVGGTSLSKREVVRLARMDLAGLNRALQDELL